MLRKIAGASLFLLLTVLFAKDALALDKYKCSAQAYPFNFKKVWVKLAVDSRYTFIKSKTISAKNVGNQGYRLTISSGKDTVHMKVFAEGKNAFGTPRFSCDIIKINYR